MIAGSIRRGGVVSVDASVEPPRGARRRTLVAWWATLTVAVSVVVIVVVDGSPWWRIIRLAVTGILGFAALRAVRSAKRSARWIELAVAVIGISVGLAYGIHRISVAGPDVLAVVGLFGLVGAVALLVCAVVGLAQGVSWWWATLRTIGFVAVAAVAVWVTAPALLATNVPPTPNEAGVDLGRPAEDVRYTNGRGEVLAAWYVPPANGAVVVMRHGAASNRSQLERHARILVRHGYGVLLTDARGHGESGGRAMDFGWQGDEDITAAIDYVVRRNDDGVRIAVLGLSMGGEEAVGAIGGDPRIEAVVAEGVTARTEEDKGWLVDRYGWRGTVQIGLEWLQYRLTDLLTEARPPIGLAEAIEAANLPVLLIAAGSVDDEVSVASVLQNTDPDGVATWSVPDAGHIGGLSTDPEAWERTVVGFLDASLGRG